MENIGQIEGKVERKEKEEKIKKFTIFLVKKVDNKIGDNTFS